MFSKKGMKPDPKKIQEIQKTLVQKIINPYKGFWSEQVHEKIYKPLQYTNISFMRITTGVHIDRRT